MEKFDIASPPAQALKVRSKKNKEKFFPNSSLWLGMMKSCSTYKGLDIATLKTIKTLLVL